MPGTYPRTESDEYEVGREDVTQAALEVIEAVEKGSGGRPSEPSRSSETSQTKSISHSELKSHRAELNKPTPNTTYQVMNATGTLSAQYKTDGLGRTTEVVVKAAPGIVDSRHGERIPKVRENFPPEGRDKRLQSEIGKQGLKGDVGFHLVAAAIGGIPNAINLVSGSGVLNNRDYATAEFVHQLQMIKGLGTDTKISVQYDGENPRPVSFRWEMQNSFFVADIDMPNE
ncbi:DNA/RNA non-specific endonuclease [uncultured Agrobacterium sp.]|uniref:DNA/RNA non-specific endonuclease n=1 Tax=uncultured Agrobacterium sp. TaxID=157277 RepID=UPI0025F2A4B9|nr:DNA/RNA non-specific endonuclease [uncultured Agrobacterium sp.]